MSRLAAGAILDLPTEDGLQAVLAMLRDTVAAANETAAGYAKIPATLGPEASSNRDYYSGASDGLRAFASGLQLLLDQVGERLREQDRRARSAWLRRDLPRYYRVQRGAGWWIQRGAL